MSGKCISHFKMLSSVSRTYYGEVALSSPIFLLLLLFLIYVLKENSRVILSLLLGFRLVWASCSMSYQAIIAIKIGTPIQFGPNLALFWPNLVHLTHFVTGVGSSNLIYAWTVVITFRNVLWPKVLGLYFQNWLLWADLAQIWPKFGPIWSI